MLTEMKETKFKETEVGRVPVDWEVKKFDDIFEILNTRKFQLKTSEYCRFGKTKIIDQGKENIVGYSDRPNPFTCPQNGVILFGDHTRIFKISKSDFFIGADGVQILHCINDDTHFLYYYCLTLDIPNTGYNRHFKYLKESSFILPYSLPEQRRIASSLSNMDNLISNLDTLIEKKRNIKQGAMRQLLTGKTRLKGFTEPWGVKKLGEVVYINPASERQKPDQFIYIDLESVKQGKLISTNMVNSASAPSRAQRQFEQSDILYQTVRPYQSNNLYVDFDAAKYIASTGYAVLRSHEDTDSRYVYMCLHSYKFIGYVLDNCTGTSYPAINPNKLAQIIIYLPSSLPEQRAIATILTNMDDEIAALEQKRDKYAALKQGMMQQLLTGKIRLTD